MWTRLANSWLGKFIVNINDAAKYADGGYSWRKLMSVPCIWIAGRATYLHTDATNLNAVIDSWFIFISFILGLVTAQQILQFKGAAPTKTEPQAVTQQPQS